jgi:hypothetical protein
VTATLGEVVTLPIGQVRPSPDNPRRITAAAVDIVAKSLAEFGWQQPLVVDTAHVLIAGHTRLLAAQKLGLPAVPVVVASNLTPAQVRAYRIADNRSGDYTSWDFSELTKQLDDLAGDFGGVLGLADWQAIVASHDALLTAGHAAQNLPPTQPAPAAAPVGQEYAQPTADPADQILAYLGHKYELTVVCDSERSARVAAAAIIDMPGVTDVRDKR